jgi:hypothetical protein
MIRHFGNTYYHTNDYNSSSNFFSILFGLIFIGVLGFIIYKIYKSCSERS